MPAQVMIDNPIKLSAKYHRGAATGLNYKGVSVIIVAKSSLDLAVAASVFVGNMDYELDYDLIEDVAVFGVES